jgi:sensor c-di-GMP phosphodiesterase-like protein
VTTLAILGLTAWATAATALAIRVLLERREMARRLRTYAEDMMLLKVGADCMARELLEWRERAGQEEVTSTETRKSINIGFADIPVQEIVFNGTLRDVCLN